MAAADADTAQPDTTEQETAYVVSADGTRIGYRSVGSGPGLVLIQGAFGTQHNFRELAVELAATFTVHLPDRRGRGLSPLPYRPDYTLARDVEDLEALLDATGTVRVFGLSAGAIIALSAASSGARIEKLAAFEPPLLLEQAGVEETLARFDRELADGDLPAAAVTGMLAAQMAPPLVARIPRRLLELTTRLGLWVQSRRKPGRYAPMRELIPALRYDFAVVAQASREVASLATIDCDVLLLAAEKSPAYLEHALDAVHEVLPGARRTTLPGVGHGAAWNSDRGGRPRTLAPVLSSFFA
jgi:pimeloyl-ACP methyl ester carboxylesterase